MKKPAVATRAQPAPSSEAPSATKNSAGVETAAASAAVASAAAIVVSPHQQPQPQPQPQLPSAPTSTGAGAGAPTPAGGSTSSRSQLDAPAAVTKVAAPVPAAVAAGGSVGRGVGGDDGDEIVVASFAAPKPSLTLRFSSSHGHAHVLGLGQVELFDSTGARMRVPPSSVHFAWTASHPNLARLGPARADVAKVCSAARASSAKPPTATATTTLPQIEDKHMWTMPFDRDTLFPALSPSSSPSSSSSSSSSIRPGFEINIFLPSFFSAPCSLLVTNYGRCSDLSGLEGSKGLKGLEVLVGGRTAWTGHLARNEPHGHTNNNANSNQPQLIVLLPGAKLPQTMQQQQQQQQQTAPVPAAIGGWNQQPVLSARSTLPVSGALSAAPNAGSASRPLWLQGPAPMAAAVADPPSAAAAAAAPPSTLLHSASATTLSRRRGSHNTLLQARDSLQTAGGGGGGDSGSGGSNAGSSAMVPPLLPASTWEASSTPAAAPPKRPMSGRRAVGPGPALPTNINAAAATAAATAANNSSASGAYAAASAAAGRRRPSVTGGDASASSSSSRTGSPSSVSRCSTMSAGEDGCGGGPDHASSSVAVAVGTSGAAAATATATAANNPAAARLRRSDLEQSWDSLEHFKHHHNGRLPAAAAAVDVDVDVDVEGTATTTAARAAGPPRAPAPAKGASKPPTTTTTAITLEDLGSERKRRSRSNSLESPPSAAVAAAASAGDDGLDNEEDDSSSNSAAAAGGAYGFGSASTSVPFAIPTLPAGRKLTLNLLSTWGDAYYIGLAGIEIFDGRGTLLSFPSSSSNSPPSSSPSSPAPVAIHASPADLNVLPGYQGDPRVVTNLLDGCNATTDDMHAWLAPFSAGKRHVIVIDLAAASNGNLPGDPTLPGSVTLGFVRLWNFNKSRIHSARGVRGLEMLLDGRLIFRGEVSQAPGESGPAAAAATENILFTTAPATLARIASQTLRAEARMAHAAAVTADFEPALPARPPTGGSSASGSAASGAALAAAEHSRMALLGDFNVHTSVDFNVARPKTAAVLQAAASAPAPAPVSSSDVGLSKALLPASASASPAAPGFSLLATELTIHLVSTWGDPYFVGLTGLEVVCGPGATVQGLTGRNLDAFPRDINTVPGHSGDNRTLDKLLDMDNCTCNDNHMWWEHISHCCHALGDSVTATVERGKSTSYFCVVL